MNPPNEAILDKIRRLLRLGQSPNKHEAELAMSKAAELAMKHAVDLAGIKSEADREKIAHESFGSKMAYNQVESFAAEVVICVFPVKIIFKRNEATIIGTPTAIECGKWALAYLIDCARRDLAAWRKTRRLAQIRPSQSSEGQWLRGWGYGIIRQANGARKAALELMDAGAAIILADQAEARNAYTAENIGKVAKTRMGKRKTDLDALDAGLKAGLATKLHKQLDGAPKEHLALL